MQKCIHGTSAVLALLVALAAAVLCAEALGASAAFDGSHSAIAFPGPEPGEATASIAGNQATLANKVLSVSWRQNGDGLRGPVIVDKLSNTVITAGGEAFLLVLGDGRIVKASELTMLGAAGTETISGKAGSAALTGRFAALGGNLQIECKAVLGNGANYVRQLITLKAVNEQIPIRTITLIDVSCPDAEVAGTVAGSPVLAGQLFFAYEHPNSASVVEKSSDNTLERIRCSLTRNMTLKPNEPLVQSLVIGVAPRGQMRRAFAYYIERERPRPYSPFLHYNSWYDIAWADRKMNEKQCLEVIEAFGRDLTQKRGVKLDSFMFDDGWDDNKTLWEFHEGFPDGFGPLVPLAKKYGSSVGVWFSPWGGYGQAKAERMKYGRTQGFETNRNGFSLAGPKYYGRFRDVCAEMIKKYDVNCFKFDGVGIGNGRDGADEEFMPDIEGLLKLCGELRELRSDVYLSITTGTWPSPYWLFHGDSIWRNGHDCGFHGAGTMRQQWITYRDMITYRMIVKRAPLYPINSLMVQGICYAQLGTATRMANDLGDIVDEIRMLFGCGTQLQELYVTPQMMTPPMWDALAEAASWSRDNADVLVDVHWIGGDPGSGEVYGYASWSPRKGIIVLRNPGQKKTRFSVDVQEAFELPVGAAQRYELTSPWANDKSPSSIIVHAGHAHAFDLAPFEALILEAAPIK